MLMDVRPHKPNAPLPFHQKPRVTLRDISYSQSHHPLPQTHTGAFLSPPSRVGHFGDLFTVRAPDQVWEGFIHIANIVL